MKPANEMNESRKSENTRIHRNEWEQQPPFSNTQHTYWPIHFPHGGGGRGVKRDENGRREGEGGGERGRWGGGVCGVVVD